MKSSLFARACWTSLLLVAGFLPSAQAALGEPTHVLFAPAQNAFPLANAGRAAPLVVGTDDWPGVQRAVRDLQADVERVTKVQPALRSTAESGNVVIVGTLGRSAVIDELVRTGKIKVDDLRGKWEAWSNQVIDRPLPGVERALVIVGSDKRGTIYGVYDLAEQIGVSPWHWWADVPVVARPALYVQPARVLHDSPAVKYRGIFLNDEAPALTGWAREKFGGLNSKFYAHVFELLLRLRGNYLWPAMWGNAFNEDDPDNARLADEYGIVMGTSHHEPMLRAQQEWSRHGKGAWNYETNGETLARFWSEGITRNKNFESIITLGMRGDGDTAMSATANVALLEKIVHDQRAILARERNPRVEEIPQLWALYKEVQEYFEKGMRVPDDVTLLWCDDNWGNIRRLPTLEERKRPGGAGVYYHFDYVGGPRSYKWLNVTALPKVWEQMHLAWQHGADRIWIVNVGDLKPMEFPIEFFLRYAWAPAQWPYERLPEFGRLWAEREFGADHAVEIAALVSGYTKLNSALRPELLSAEAFSQVNYDEAARVVATWQDLVHRATALRDRLPAAYRDAYFQLVLWPIQASANTAELYVTAGRNQLYALQGRAETNSTANRVRELFQADVAITKQYNEELGQGRWRHFADQTHLGYYTWQQPTRNTMPPVGEIQPSSWGELGVAVEGAPAGWPGVNPGRWRPMVPPLHSLARESRWIEVFNRGLGAVEFKATASAPWLRVSETAGTLTGPATRRLTVDVDWATAPEGKTDGNILLEDQRGTRVRVLVPVTKHSASTVPAKGSFVESDGTVAIEAIHYAKALAEPDIEWKVLPDLGRSAGGVTPFPVTAESRELSGQSPHLEYRIHTVSTGEATLELILSPTLAFLPNRGLRLAVSVDDEPPQLLDLKMPVGEGSRTWERMMQDSVRKITTKHTLSGPGAHVIKVWMVDPAVVLQRLVLRFGAERPSFFGPPESPQQ